MLKEITIPDLGEGIDTVEVGEIAIKPGDHVDLGDILVVLESDKASLEIEAEDAGTIKEIRIKAGTEVRTHTVLAMLELDQQPTSEQPPETAVLPEVTPEPSAVEAPTPVEEELATPPIEAPQTKRHLVSASPSVRRFARELGCELDQVVGSGPKGRVLKEDIQTFVKDRLSGASNGLLSHPTPAEIDFSQWGEIERVRLSKIRRVAARNLQQAWQTIPHVTQYDETDITDLEAFRQVYKHAAAKASGKLSILPFIMKAVARALQTFPDFNSSLDARGEQLIHKKYIHLGIAVDTEAGLVVPVIRDVDQKSLIDLSVELVDVSVRTRQRKIKPAELVGATFSISSLGGISGTGFSPIVNPPQVAILGVSKARIQPKFNGQEFLPRLMLPFSLAYDHRVIDGAAAARFTKLIAEDLTVIKDLF